MINFVFEMGLADDIVHVVEKDYTLNVSVCSSHYECKLLPSCFQNQTTKTHIHQILLISYSKLTFPWIISSPNH